MGDPTSFLYNAIKEFAGKDPITRAQINTNLVRDTTMETIAVANVFFGVRSIEVIEGVLRRLEEQKLVERIEHGYETRYRVYGLLDGLARAAAD